MLETLKTRGVGPAEEMDMTFGSRVNLITGDNGLGKTFILELIWWCLTQSWINNPIMGRREIDPFIEWSIVGQGEFDKVTLQETGTSYNWTQTKFIQKKDAIIIYAKSDGGFVHYDPYDINRLGNKYNEFSEYELWHGLPDPVSKNIICRGLLADWQFWSTSNAEQRINFSLKQKPIFENFKLDEKFIDEAVKRLDERLLITPISKDFQDLKNKLPEQLLDEQKKYSIKKFLTEDLYVFIETLYKDVSKKTEFTYFKDILDCLCDEKDKIKVLDKFTTLYGSEELIPVVQMPYGELPITLASSAIKRILSITYLIVWSVFKHVNLALATQKSPTQKIIFLLDEVDIHLHPRWQRHILPAIIRAIDLIDPKFDVQIIANTHSPIVMASMEPHFDKEKDAWFDLDFNTEFEKVVLNPKTFISMGDAANWLSSEAFDQPSGGRSVESEAAIKLAETVMQNPNPSEDAINQAKQALIDAHIPDVDPIWFSWRMTAERQGWPIK